MPKRADEYGAILNSNEIVLQRLRGTCPLDAETLLGLGVTGPLLRAAGNPWDLRKAAPYSSYEDFEFKIPVGTVGDNYDRFAVRLAEIYESVKIVAQALDGLPEGPHITADRKVALPPRHELATSMEALIHHFKLVTEGFRVPPGEMYYPIESPRGELACYVRSDGSSKPARVHMRDPSFVNLQALAPMARGSYIADMIATTAMLDPILGRHRPMILDTHGGAGSASSTDRRSDAIDRCGQHVCKARTALTAYLAQLALRAQDRRSLEDGSVIDATRGWDVPADLDKDPATIPDPATTPVPEELRQEIEAHMALYPDTRSAALPALAGRPARARLVLARRRSTRSRA